MRVDLFGSTATEAMQHTMEFARARHQVLAHDVANVDTPGFRSLDLSKSAFQQTLARAIDRSKQTGQPIDAGRRPDEARELGHQLVFHDDNNRSIEQLMVELTKNANLHSQAAGLLQTQIRLLRAVITESA